ncbi:MAG: DUF3494 domain-containing protein [Sphingobacteriales bacterium]|nr:MAG: DUF3494 domain-containing protein [Sphingobacteriales bacterium]
MNKFIQLTIATVLCTTSLTFAQAPPLGTAASFALFTTAGAITNTGISQVTGNIGLETGAITGFGNVNGNLYSGGLPATAASADVFIAYTFLDNAIPTSFLASPLGNGDTLSGGIYSVFGNTTISDTLFLDGLADPSSVFIMQVEGPLSSTASTQVVLLNGAQACNVFWKVEGLLSLASLTSMKGTLIANNAAIDMASGVTLEGRALTTAGAITLNNALIYTPVGCNSPYLTGPPAPVMGSAGCYVLFSADGPVTNFGISSATGDIGTNVGLTTGYDPLLVTGTIHPIPDGSTSACATDLLVAHTNLDILAHDIELLYPAQFGNDLVLTPHTYLLNAATALTDTVTLNGQGNADAVFVFKINGALSTATFAKVVLTNGTQAKNVFWKVEGAANLSDSTQFKGTIIVNNGAITTATGVLLEGRAMTTTGALSTSAITATMPGDCSIPLPIEWLSFNGRYSNGAAVLDWRIANSGLAKFVIERSADGNNFLVLGTIEKAAAGQQQASQYGYTDDQPLALGYYRIIKIEQDGTRSYSAVVKILSPLANNNVATVSPNPVNREMNVVLRDGLTSENNELKLYNMTGLEVLHIDLKETRNSLNIELPNGIYLYRILHNNEVVQSGKVIVKH